MSSFQITVASESDLGDLLVLMRAYCDFYEVDPSDDALLALSRALIADPELEGVQLLARDEGGAPQVRDRLLELGHDRGEQHRDHERSVCRCPAARGSGLAERLIQECLSRCAARGASRLEWMTAPGERCGRRPSMTAWAGSASPGRSTSSRCQGADYPGCCGGEPEHAGVFGQRSGIRRRDAGRWCSAAAAAAASPSSSAAPYEYLGWGEPQPPAK